MDENLENLAEAIEPPRYSGLLFGVIKAADGSRRVIYDGVEMALSEAPLTPAEWDEVQAA